MEIPPKIKRKFIPEDINLSSWEEIKPYFEELENRKINSVEELEKLLHDLSEISSAIDEEGGWKYIKMTINTLDKNLSEDYQNFIEEVQAKIIPHFNTLNKKIYTSDFYKDLNNEKYKIMIRSIKNRIEIYRERNVKLKIELEKLGSKFRKIIGAMEIEHDGKTLTIQQAQKLLLEPNRNLREEIYKKIYKRRFQDKEKIDELYDKLISLRDKVAKNADYKNYRDYKFDSLERFDYTPDDCKQFHNSVETEIMPIVNDIYKSKKEKMNLNKFKPWDAGVDEEGRPPLKPFENSKELIENSIKILENINPLFSDTLKLMNKMNRLDLESKKGKAPGGYNYRFPETHVPFVFMNATGTHQDLETMMHETGHAIHSILTKDLELLDFKECPMETAELASMTMELISMEYWNTIYNEEDLKRAKKEKLEDAMLTLPWVAAIDSFQHWIYENPNHTTEERENKWNSIMDKFNTKVINWDGQEEIRSNLWQRQLHLFEYPFYYIEYAISQLGAIAIYKNFKEDKEKTINQYIKALKLGNTKTIPEVYEAAGIKFDFSREYIKELAEFIKKELADLDKN